MRMRSYVRERFKVRLNRQAAHRPARAGPGDLELTYTPEFTDIVHELRRHIGAMRKPTAAAVTGVSQ